MDSLPQLSFINNRYRKTMRRTGVIALIMMLILNLFAAFYIHVADAATGQTIVMDKTQFKQSEAITLKYTGAAANGQDWIGIYRPGDTPGPIGALSWKYAPAGNGTMSLASGLTPGDYKVLFFSNGGYTELARTTVKVIVPVSGVSLDQPSVRITQGTTAVLRAIIAPANATDPSVSWTSSDPSIVSVTATGGIATLNANLPGTATVTSTTYDGNFTASASVRVDPPGNNLTNAIAAAQAKIDSASIGSKWGQYSQSAASALKAAISAANAVWSNVNATQAEIDQSVIALNSALQSFVGAVNVKASIGDLAIISSHYGSTSASSDWADIQKYDINQDNEISIIDLDAFAKKILN